MLATQTAPAQTPPSTLPALTAEDLDQTAERLIAKHGEELAERIRRGVRQAGQRWWTEDGDATAFAAFCEANFIADTPEDTGLERAFERLQTILEQVDGHLHEVRRDLTAPLDLDTGPLSPLDQLLGNLDLAPHVDDDLFATKTAFFALLNFPIHSLRERMEKGPHWSRRDWARSRMMDRFSLRVPAAVQQESNRVYTAGDQYIGNYNLRLDRLITPEGERLFPEGLRLLTHWGLRDELAGTYVDRTPEGLRRQRTIFKVMERIVRQEIPAAVIDNPALLWEPFGNEVRPAAPAEDFDAEAASRREPDARYAQLLEVFRAARKIDPYSPEDPTLPARRFNRDVQIPEEEVEALLVSVLDSQEVKDLGALIQRRLGRPLEPFDIWYSGFKSRGRYSEEELDRRVRERYSDVEALAAGLPAIFERLGFTSEKAAWLSERIVVQASRGAGHALAAMRRGDKSYLRTRVPQGGMSYQGYNTAMHELGHNAEQVFSLDGIDEWFLAGVPNNAFTEAIAFVFQHRDLEVLGVEASPDAAHDEALATLWNTYEIGGCSLVEMKIWRWLYQHPETTPAELREAVLAIAREVWNRYFAPVFGVRDSDILAVYSHMIFYGLYLPYYSVGHIIAFQVAERVQGEHFGEELERVVRQGRLTPDAWMRGAVGGPVSSEALLRASRRALEALAG
ncbi:MAG TPA: hypothetical protein VHN15_07530 [Thermoanaerobaculia bacterium]|nr:hypothetical protein [Thermoanaerobaculia bacterium]